MQAEKAGNGYNARIEQFLDDIKLVVRDGQELLKTGVGSLKEKARTGAAQTDRFVREQPYYGIGLAFAVGMVAGLLAARLLPGGEAEEE